jgi:hypothetical protein
VKLVNKPVRASRRLVTVRLVADAFPSVDVPEVIVENTPVVLSTVVKVGVADIEIVEVEERITLVPAVRYATGVLKKEFQLDDDAVSGTEYPKAVPRVNMCSPVPVLLVIVSVSPPEVEVAND